VTDITAPRFIVWTRHNGKIALEPRDLDQTNAVTTFVDILSGQIEHVHEVWVLEGGQYFDVSKSLAEDICSRAERDCEKLRPDLIDFCEHHLGVRALHGLRAA
jgi:hypothetical protein